MIYQRGPISRLEISEKLELALPTITTNVATLIAKGLVKEVENAPRAEKTLGRRTTLIDIAEDSRYFIGIEMRGALRRACVSDYRGNRLYTAADDTFYADYEENIRATCEMAKKLLSREDVRDKIAGVGICVPGLVDSGKGILRVHPGYQWRNKDLRRDAARLLGYEGPISVENNACARAYGAHLFHQDLLREAQSFAYLYISAGIACPLCFNSLSPGGTIAGEGEVGHMVMDPAGPVCSCGNRGCLEAYASERAVLDRAAVALRTGHAPILRKLCPGPEEISIEKVLEAQDQGDPAILAIMEDAVTRLGLAIANIDNFVRPDTMLIESKFFLQERNRIRLLEVIHQNLYTETVMDVKFSFVPPDAFSGALGAAAAAIREDLKAYVE